MILNTLLNIQEFSNKVKELQRKRKIMVSLKANLSKQSINNTMTVLSYIQLNKPKYIKDIDLMKALGSKFLSRDRYFELARLVGDMKKEVA